MHNYTLTCGYEYICLHIIQHDTIDSLTPVLRLTARGGHGSLSGLSASPLALACGRALHGAQTPALISAFLHPRAGGLFQFVPPAPEKPRKSNVSVLYLAEVQLRLQDIVLKSVCWAKGHVHI